MTPSAHSTLHPTEPRGCTEAQEITVPISAIGRLQSQTRNRQRSAIGS